MFIATSSSLCRSGSREEVLREQTFRVPPGSEIPVTLRPLMGSRARIPPSSRESSSCGAVGASLMWILTPVSSPSVLLFRPAPRPDPVLLQTCSSSRPAPHQTCSSSDLLLIRPAPRSDQFLV
ncbi:unnamed protein product [Boreogadus saida]